MSPKIPVLLDTDIGSDIDDALCLAYLLKQPACELLGVTTVSGEPEKRAGLADAICRRVGRGDVPIYPGAARPLLGAQRQAEARQASILDKWPHREDFPRDQAVDFLRRAIHGRPGEITLLAIGPMTNVALLFALDPEAFSMLKQLVLMCGVFTTRADAGRIEWNASVDPAAAAMVYQAPVKRHLSIGLDVTTRCVLDRERAARMLRGGVLEPVADMASVWFEQAPEITFHDPLAAAVIFAPELCRYDTGVVSVELQSSRLAGLTAWAGRADNPPHTIAVDVRPEAFFDHYFEVVKS